MPASWDSHLKLLMAHAAQDYLTWFVEDAIVDEELSTHLQRHCNADSFYSFHIGMNKYALHLEFQTRHDNNMERRLWEYNVIASCKFDRPIYSVVIFLTKDNVNTVSPYIVYDHNGSEIHHFQFTVIKLWEIPTEMLFTQRFKGLLPLAPLTREGQSREVVEKVITELQSCNADKELLSILYGLSALAFKTKDDKEWLKGRFSMLDEILNETWAFKEWRRQAEGEGRKKGLKEGLKKGRKKGREEGREEGLQQNLNILVSFIQARFPILMPLADECRHVIKSAEKVQELVLQVGLAQSEDEARQHLLAALKSDISS